MWHKSPCSGCLLARLAFMIPIVAVILRLHQHLSAQPLTQHLPKCVSGPRAGAERALSAGLCQTSPAPTVSLHTWGTSMRQRLHRARGHIIWPSCCQELEGTPVRYPRGSQENQVPKELVPLLWHRRSWCGWIVPSPRVSHFPTPDLGR